ncbi:MAG TPA: SUMF1/EgtB/PvdO family nonheme iron enzyme [Candidatus Xenobia bacterium]|jgi:iron(II)-dependent oxidoreductase
MLLLLGIGGALAATRALATPPPEWTNPKDGSVMVLVSAGPFTMGSSQAEVDAVYQDVTRHVGAGMDKDWYDREVPAHTVQTGAYYIGKYAVTNAQYRRFVSATGYQTVGVSPTFPGAPPQWEAYAEQWGETAPVVEVSWEDAKAYCHWAGVRLPTEVEWEKAARGTDGRRYPWGNEWDPSRCHCQLARTGGGRAPDGAAPVGSYPSGASPYGCLDMEGNVMQWTDSWYQAYPGSTDPSGDCGQKYRVMRGCCWDYDFSAVYRAALRSYHRPGDHAFGVIGFRVARTP